MTVDLRQLWESRGSRCDALQTSMRIKEVTLWHTPTSLSVTSSSRSQIGWLYITIIQVRYMKPYCIIIIFIIKKYHIRSAIFVHTFPRTLSTSCSIVPLICKLNLHQVQVPIIHFFLHIKSQHSRDGLIHTFRPSVCLGMDRDRHVQLCSYQFHGIIWQQILDTASGL